MQQTFAGDLIKSAKVNLPKGSYKKDQRTSEWCWRKNFTIKEF